MHPAKTIALNGNTYTIEQTDDEIHLQRYNETYGLWVNIYFPAEDKPDETLLTDLLLELYIQKHLPEAAEMPEPLST